MSSKHTEKNKKAKQISKQDRLRSLKLVPSLSVMMLTLIFGITTLWEAFYLQPTYQAFRQNNVASGTFTVAEMRREPRPGRFAGGVEIPYIDIRGERVSILYNKKASRSPEYKVGDMVEVMYSASGKPAAVLLREDISLKELDKDINRFMTAGILLSVSVAALAFTGWYGRRLVTTK